MMDNSEHDSEIGRLRREVQQGHAIWAAALSRATRLAQLVSSLVPLTDPQEILDRAAQEVAEQFGADVAAVLVPSDGSGPDGPMTLAAHWGIPDRNLPEAVDEPPASVAGIDPIQPLAGPAADLGVPSWLQRSRPSQIVWAKLVVRGNPLGYMVLSRRSDEPFSPDDVKELGLVVSRIALAFDNGRLYTRTQEQVHRLKRLHEVAAELAGTLDIDRVVDSLAATVLDEVATDGVAVYLAGKQGLELATEAGTIADAPAEIVTEAIRAWPDDNLVLMGTGGPPVGALLLAERPPAGTEADSFLQHLADLGTLTIGKSLLFDRVRAQAESDPLTGLPNRNLLMGRLESALAMCRNNGTDLAVVFVDLDEFKSVNDTYGHDVGDQLLVAVAGRLSDMVEPTDTVARLGGDEFVVMRADIDAEEAYAVAERLRAAMGTPFELGDVIVGSQASVGLAMASANNYHAKKLMRDADAKMYVDKLRDHHRLEGRAPSRPPTLAEADHLAQRMVPGGGGRTRARAGTAGVALAEQAAEGAVQSWCDAWIRHAGPGIHGPAEETVQRVLSTAREQLEMELVWLSRFVNGRHVFEAFAGDPSRYRLAVGSSVALSDSYCVRVLEGRLPAVLPDTRADDRTVDLPITHQLRLGAYVGAPVFVRHGELFGMLCAVSREPEPSLRHRDSTLLRRLAGLLSEPLTAALARDVQASAFVRNAEGMLNAGGMTVDLQPIVHLPSGNVVSVEALARFALYPYSVEGWFAQAHEAGCGPEMEIDAVVNACRVLSALPRPLTLAINASPDVACSPELLRIVTAVEPERIIVEITEHRRASQPATSAAAIARLKAHGVQVALDDAGTGYSDLRQILELQPDIVKLDRALVNGVDSDSVKAALVQALVAFGHDTGMRLIAEGISSVEIRDTLRELRVDFGQGFALGRPEPAAAIISRLP
jgi:diguanylate cyclase (GGDEF)-like protein